MYLTTGRENVDQLFNATEQTKSSVSRCCESHKLVTSAWNIPGRYYIESTSVKIKMLECWKDRIRTRTREGPQYGREHQCAPVVWRQ